MLPRAAMMFGDQLERALRTGRRAGEGSVVSVDDGDVLHVHLDSQPVRGSRSVTSIRWQTEQGDDDAELHIEMQADGGTTARYKLMEEDGPTWIPVSIVETGATSFTRNTPLVETRALQDKTVLCIGLGSGGSAVVDQLARAGVGSFLLWDKDRLEAHNLSRHVCVLRDLGRRKTAALREHVLGVNPSAKVRTIDGDVLAAFADGSLAQWAAEADCVVVGTDNNASRFAINDVAYALDKTAFYGRAYTRAAGGDVIQVIPGQTPCYACHIGDRVVPEEVSSPSDAERVAYADVRVTIEPGLNIDISPLANMLARLALLRLCEGASSSLERAASELRAPLYLWANRREEQFANWEPMARSFDRLSILRWYAVNVFSDKECQICSSKLFFDVDAKL